MRKDGSYIKKMRLQEIAQFIARAMNNGNANYRKILSWIQFEIGLSEARASEYIRLICEVKDWHIKRGNIEPLER